VRQDFSASVRQDFSVRAPHPIVLLLVGGASVQFGAAFATELFSKVGPGGTVLLRIGLSAVMLLAITRPSFRGRTRADWTAVVAFGLVLGGMNWTFYESLARMPLGAAVTIELMGPLMLAVIGSRRRLDLVWVALAVGGVLLLAVNGRDAGSGDKQVTTVGVLLALAAGTLWVGYILLSKRVGAAFSQLDGLALALGVATFLVLPVGIVQGGSDLLHPSVFFGGLVVAVLSSLIPYSLELIALRRISAATFGLLMSLEPAMAALAGALVLGQSLTALATLAIAMVIGASIGTTYTSREPLPAVLE
jgi:inner membrane transporter RhtA